jgi:hypothetical protein
MPSTSSPRRSASFNDEVATLHHTWLLVLLARVRARRGRLAEAEATLRSAPQARAELTDAGTVPALADEVERELEAPALGLLGQTQSPM